MPDYLFGLFQLKRWHTGFLLPLLVLCGCASDGRVRVTSENFNSRVGIVVIHHTAEDFAESLRLLTQPTDRPVSSHYLIPEPDDPTYGEAKLRIYELVPETDRAWHAGNSYWGERIALNDQSIGIELVNRTYCHTSPMGADTEIVAAEGPGVPGAAGELSVPARICFYPDFAESQMTLLIGLLEDIQRRHPGIRPTQIVGHSDIAPERKIDPGPRFPWQRLYRLGYGAWYDDEAVIRYWERFRGEPLPLRNIQRALKVYGYRIDANGEYDAQTRNVLRAFQMHFRPSQSSGRVTTETVAVLYALIEKYYPDRLDELLQVEDPAKESAGELLDSELLD